MRSEAISTLSLQENLEIANARGIMISAMHNLKIKNFDDVHRLLAELPPPCEITRAQVRRRETRLTKPQGALGRLEELTEWLATWQRLSPPRTEHIRAIVFAGTHGVTNQRVSAYPSEVTSQMVANFQAGGAAVNQLCTTFGVDLDVVPFNLDRPTRDFTLAPAMEESECIEAIQVGLDKTDHEMDVLCVGEMGIGNTTAAAALAHALFGGDVRSWVGSGTGVKGEAYARKRAVVERAVHDHSKHTEHPLELLCRLGGRELAAMLGAVLGARFSRTPVVLDGYVTTAAVAPLFCLQPAALDHCISGHVSTEPGHRMLLERLGLRPLLNLDMRLGEASGAVLAAALLRAAVACHTGMATFQDAGIATQQR